MMSLALDVLSEEYRQAAEYLADLDLDAQTVMDTLEAVSSELTDKVRNVAMLIRNQESMAEQIKAAEAQMAKRRKPLRTAPRTSGNTYSTTCSTQGFRRWTVRISTLRFAPPRPPSRSRTCGRFQRNSCASPNRRRPRRIRKPSRKRWKPVPMCRARGWSEGNRCAFNKGADRFLE